MVVTLEVPRVTDREVSTERGPSLEELNELVAIDYYADFGRELTPDDDEPRHSNTAFKDAVDQYGSATTSKNDALIALNDVRDRKVREFLDADPELTIELAGVLADGDKEVCELYKASRMAECRENVAERIKGYYEGWKVNIDRLTASNRRLGRQVQAHFAIRRRQNRGACVASRRGRAARVSTNSRTQGSRRSRTGSSSSSSDPGDPDPDGSRSRSAGESFSRGHRFCLGCGEPLVGRRPQTLYCGDACKQTYYRNGRIAAKPISRGWQTAVQRVNLAASMWPERDRARFILAVIEVVAAEQKRLLATSPGNKHWIDFYNLMLHGKGPANAYMPGLWASLRKARCMSDHGDAFRGSRPARRVKNVRGVLA